MSTIYCIKEERRMENKKISSENRSDTNKYVFQNTLDDVIEFQKDEQNTLLLIIDNKEKKKLMVTHVSFLLFTVLAAMVAAILTFLSKEGLNEVTKISLFVALTLILIGINSINLSVIKYIAAFKREIVLSLRQLNCIRQSIASVIFAKLEGKLPNDNFCKDKGESESKSLNNLYWPLYGSHIKYPIDNILLRNIYLKEKKDGREVHDYKALYRSADLFTISAIFFFTIALNVAPLAVILMFHVETQATIGSFNDGVVFAFIVGSVMLLFILFVWRIARSFFAIVASPLKKNSSESSDSA